MLYDCFTAVMRIIMNLNMIVVCLTVLVAATCSEETKDIAEYESEDSPAEYSPQKEAHLEVPYNYQGTELQQKEEKYPQVGNHSKQILYIKVDQDSDHHSHYQTRRKRSHGTKHSTRSHRSRHRPRSHRSRHSPRSHRSRHGPRSHGTMHSTRSHRSRHSPRSHRSRHGPRSHGTMHSTRSNRSRHGTKHSHHATRGHSRPTHHPTRIHT